MAKGTGISWAHNTRNVIIGCKAVSPECALCYAIPMSLKLATSFNQERYAGLARLNVHGYAEWTEDYKFVPEVLDETRRATRPQTGEPYRNFWCSMGDVFYEPVKKRELDLIQACWEEVDWQIHMVLTKRTARMGQFFRRAHRYTWESPVPAHIWPATTIGTRKRLQEDGWELTRIPAHVRWVSAEPLLEPLDFRPLLSSGRLNPNGFGWEPVPSHLAGADSRPLIDCMVIGGESDQGRRHARVCRLEWIRDLVAQCREFGVRVHVKQLGSHLKRELGLKHSHGGNPEEWPEDLRIRELPDNKVLREIQGYQPHLRIS